LSTAATPLNNWCKNWFNRPGIETQKAVDTWQTG
jgi:hypothetical protein